MATITVHAVERFRERVAPDLTYWQCLGAVLRLAGALPPQTKYVRTTYEGRPLTLVVEGGRVVTVQATSEQET